MIRMLLALSLTACTDGPGGSKDSSGDAEVTWYRDVGPLVNTTCAACHGPKGVSGIDLTDPDNAVRMADLMADQVTSGQMPPAAADPGCRAYANDDALTLNDDERALIARWAELGAPLGDPADAPEVTDEIQRLGDPDITLTMPFPYTPELDADGNEYWCVQLENPTTDPVWITGLDVDLGNSSVVHHMLLIKDTGGDAGEAYGIDNPEDGFACRDPMMEDDWSILHAWAPGMGATFLPDGTGMELAPGDQIILQMHYYWQGDAAPDPDQSSYLLSVTDQAPDDEVEVYPIGPTDFTIPADDADYQVYAELPWTYALDITIYGVFPHEHLLGKDYRAWIVGPDGTETCLASGDWDFHHQAFYMYDQPALLTQGDTLAGYCDYDNSADNPNQYNSPPAAVSYGEGTNQEMCYFLFYLSY